MSSDDYQVQDIYRYARKSYKKNCRRGAQENVSCNPEDDNGDSDLSPGSDRVVTAVNIPSCNCDMDQDGDVANILHKKCPVITLAKQQLQRLMDDDKVTCGNRRCCRSIYDFVCICRELLRNQNKRTCILICVITMAFLIGILFGAASCGSYLRQFNSPILMCLDKLFISNSRAHLEDFRGII